MSFETVKDSKDLELATSRLERRLRAIDFNLKRLPTGPARNLDRLPASISKRLDHRVSLTQHLRQPFSSATEVEEPTEKRQALEIQRAELRVEHRDFLSHNLAIAEPKEDDDLASAISDSLNNLDIKIWEKNVAAKPKSTPTGERLARTVSGRPNARFQGRPFKKRQYVPAAGLSPKSTAISLHLVRRRAVLQVATKLAAIYKRADAKRERPARPQVRKRAIKAL